MELTIGDKIGIFIAWAGPIFVVFLMGHFGKFSPDEIQIILLALILIDTTTIGWMVKKK